MAEATQLDVEQEMLRVQMDDSREALAQKIEALEEKVTETVQSATATVAEATASVMETVQSATASVTDTVDSVTNAVQGTVDNVRQSVEGTVDSVKGAFDIPRQFGQHPWLMFAGAAAVGYVGGIVLRGSTRLTPSSNGLRPTDGGYRTPRSNGTSFVPPTAFDDTPTNDFHSDSSNTSAPSNSTEANWLSQLGEAFAPEIAKLQGMAVGVLFGSVRDMIVENVPEPLQKQVADVVDGFTEKLGGQCIHGSLAGSGPASTHCSR